MWEMWYLLEQILVLVRKISSSNKKEWASYVWQKDAAQRAKQALVSEMTKGGANIATAQQSDHLAMAAAYTTWITLATQVLTPFHFLICDCSCAGVKSWKNGFQELFWDSKIIQYQHVNATQVFYSCRKAQKLHNSSVRQISSVYPLWKCWGE